MNTANATSGLRATLNVRREATLTEEQITSVLNKLVPLIAEPADHEFFRGVLALKAERMLACDFALFVGDLLEAAQ